MSDIVERLKDAFDHNAVCHCGSGIGGCDNHDFCWMPDDDTQMLSDAKHEIERLREEVKRWKAEAMAWRKRAKYDGSKGEFNAIKMSDADIEVQSARAANVENTNG